MTQPALSPKAAVFVSCWIDSREIANKEAHRVPTLPVGVGGSAGFRSEDGRGAVLLTGGDITHNRIVHDDHLSEWFDLNAATIARDYKTTQRKGVWIITSTYTATKRAERVLLDKQSEATFSIDVTLHDAGKLAASTGFWSGSRDESWTAHEDVSVYLTADEFAPHNPCSWSHSIHFLLLMP